MIANTPKLLYYAVTFPSYHTDIEGNYVEMTDKMKQLAAQQEGFLGVESARNVLGITVSYWSSLEAIKNWKHNLEHSEAREKGRSTWYKNFKVRICKIERDYEFEV